MNAKYKPHKLRCVYCDKIFYSDDPFVCTADGSVYELECHEKFIKDDRLRRKKTQEDTE
jgi:hypothetical protein